MLRKYIQNFIYNINAVISIEIAFIMGIVLILILGIMELSILFAISSGLEDLMRSIGRQSSSISGTSYNTYLMNGGDLGRNKYFTQTVHKRIINILLNPEDAQLCIETYQSMKGFIDNGFPTKCAHLSNNISSSPNNLDWGTNGDFVSAGIIYKHKYLTPIGGLIASLGSDIELSTVSFFRRE